ncbi:prion-inhibition and propagation-domain-containing protein [Annulohypoxylon maeteangense]|uniref:prion-inhibition and propagation-domain-containing protein n=1 Tax=Annulohypoxylon maeteangense TaxID=1927788 RepID=UPI0020082A0F|nr:prion-inhibition and propagation-domain-containing protein [Annulohypoxylon maeteangense]KAI0888403.1 prion-inhibition and propagation-domain-containing protein [Annulohypoxylon maeteangense]
MEVAGLAVGVLGIAGLFTSCIENFNIVVRAREFSEEFEQLCTLLALHQIRLVIWGETLGLAPPPGARTPRPYNRALDRPDIRPYIETTLYQLKNLLSKADTITGRYASEEQERAAECSEIWAGSNSKGMSIFRDSYERFKARIKKNQKDASVWQVTRWSIHDYEKFERLVTNIRELVDALESITSALGISAQQQSILIDEIESLSDASSLRLLQLVGSSASAPPAIRAISDTASTRLTYVTSSSRSYHTARTEQSQVGRYDHLKTMLSKAQAAEASQPHGRATIRSGEGINTGTSPPPETTATQNITLDVPQNQRWMAALMNGKTTDPTMKLAFSTKDLEYGQALENNRDHDNQVYRDNCAKLIARAHEGIPLARRMFLELRNIRRANIPFISAAPMGDTLDRIVASIEGPPGTPFEGGTFWVTVKITESKPPMLKFHTKIYHPNIDPQGKVCADYATWWRDASLLNDASGATNQRALPWFSEHITNHYSLGSLLVALCGLLASPNIDDPLVPEIAEKYLTDYEAYCEAAKLYTERFAHAERPDDAELHFPEEDNKVNSTLDVTEYRPKPSTVSLGPRQIIIDSSLVWERISSYQLDLSKLEALLSEWFPDIDIVCNTTAHERWYCFALPKSLTSSQRQEIHKLRSVKDERADTSDSDDDKEEKDSPADSASETDDRSAKIITWTYDSDSSESESVGGILNRVTRRKALKNLKKYLIKRKNNTIANNF